MNRVLCTEEDARVAELRRRLDEFYRTTEVYDAFKATNTQPGFWDPIRAEIQRLSAGLGGSRRVRVLEFGAGRTGFGDYLRQTPGLRERVEFHVQDVTPANAEFLAGQADRVHIGDVAGLSGPYDVIFSTFVWEHVSNPKAVLSHLLSALETGGSLFMASPRYDLPGYVPPTARHYGPVKRAGLMASVLLKRLATRLGGPARFFIHIDPSLFHRPWYRDADAIHWVSMGDLRRALPAACSLHRPALKANPGLKSWVWKNFCLLFVQIRKDRTGDTRLRGVGAAQPGAVTA